MGKIMPMPTSSKAEPSASRNAAHTRQMRRRGPANVHDVCNVVKILGALFEGQSDYYLKI
jgi:hypothetical protein